MLTTHEIKLIREIARKKSSAAPHLLEYVLREIEERTAEPEPKPAVQLSDADELLNWLESSGNEAIRPFSSSNTWTVRDSDSLGEFVPAHTSIREAIRAAMRGEGA